MTKQSPHEILWLKLWIWLFNVTKKNEEKHLLFSNNSTTESFFCKKRDTALTWASSYRPSHYNQCLGQSLYEILWLKLWLWLFNYTNQNKETCFNPRSFYCHPVARDISFRTLTSIFYQIKIVYCYSIMKQSPKSIFMRRTRNNDMVDKLNCL